MRTGHACWLLRQRAGVGCCFIASISCGRIFLSSVSRVPSRSVIIITLLKSIRSLLLLDSEPESVALMDKFLKENGYLNDMSELRPHHEIYRVRAYLAAPHEPVLFKIEHRRAVEQHRRDIQLQLFRRY